MSSVIVNRLLRFTRVDTGNVLSLSGRADLLWWLSDDSCCSGDCAAALTIAVATSCTVAIAVVSLMLTSMVRLGFATVSAGDYECLKGGDERLGTKTFDTGSTQSTYELLLLWAFVNKRRW